MFRQRVNSMRVATRFTKLNRPDARSRSNVQSILELLHRREKGFLAVGQDEGGVHEIQSIGFRLLVG